MQSYKYKFSSFINMFFKKKDGEKKAVELPELPQLQRSNFPKMEGYQESIMPIPDIAERNFPNTLQELSEDSNFPALSSSVDNKLKIREIDYPSTEHKEQMMEKRFKPGRIMQEIPEKKQVKETNDSVFVRLDKFEQAIKSFQEVKSMLKDMESLLSKVKETKINEDKELARWEAEIGQVKSSLEDIDNKLFK